MTTNLYSREREDLESQMETVESLEPGMWKGFNVTNIGKSAAHLAVRSLAGLRVFHGALPVAQDYLRGLASGAPDTELQDRFFAGVDEGYGKLVREMTPDPQEVGMAAQMTGSLLFMLPAIIAAPTLGITAMAAGETKELMDEGVPWQKALAVGGVTAAGLGLGFRVPILGRNLVQRMLIGGAGFNVAQGILMRGGAAAVLGDDPQAARYPLFDPAYMFMDIVMGAGFGLGVQLHPGLRAQGKGEFEALLNWTRGIKPSHLDALALLRQSQHLNIDSLPGKPATAKDIEFHVERIKRGLEQAARNEPINVTDMPEPRFEIDAAREAENAAHVKELTASAEEVRIDENIPPVPRELTEGPAAEGRVEPPPPPGDIRPGVAGPEAEGIPPASPAEVAAADAYPIELSPTLVPELRQVEARFARQIQKDPAGAMRAYDKLPDTENGKILNTDLARELSQDYAASKEARSRLSAAVHEPASALVKTIYAAKLAEPAGQHQLDMVTFTAGGTGAGKTGAIVRTKLASIVARVSQIVYDTNMNTLGSSITKIEQALAAGKRATIIYVGRDPVESLRGAIERAKKTGRTVPITEHAKTHIGAAEVSAKLLDRYADNDNVAFVHLDNSGGKGEVRVIDQVDARTYLKSFNFDNLEARLRDELEAQRQAGKVPDAIYQGFKGDVAPGAGEAPGGGRAGEPAGEHGQLQERGAELQREEVGGAAEPDPLRDAAIQYTNENPDRLIPFGEDADGNTTYRSLREYLDEELLAAQEAREDTSLLHAAAQCLYGRA